MGNERKGARTGLPCILLLALGAFFVFGLLILLEACSTPILLPEASASLVSARGLPVSAPSGESSPEGEGSPGEGDDTSAGKSGVLLVVRVEVRGSLAVERFGITVKAKSGLREYWHTEILEERIPPSASVVLELRLYFDSESEAYLEGSSLIESSWFE